MTTQDRWAEYSCLDGTVTAQIWNQLEADMKEQDYWDFYRHTMALYPALIFMSTHGLKVNDAELARTRDRVLEQMAERQKILDKEVGRPLNANSPKQCMEYFYDELGNKPYKGARGKDTIDDKALARLNRRGIKAAKYVQDIRGLRKLHSNYLDVVADPDGRLRSQFDPRGTKTGRLSSKQTIFKTGLNFQNLPPEFKTFLIPDEGHVFLEMDKTQAEWIITAYASGDPKMIEAIENGEDIHITTAAHMTGLPRNLIERESKIIGKSTDTDYIFTMRQNHIPEIFDESNWLPRFNSCRQAGKKNNHGNNYMQGYRSHSIVNEIPEQESKYQIDLYRGTYCNLSMWWDSIKATLAKNNRRIVNCWGQKRVFRGEWNAELLKAAVAHIPQSTVVYIINDGLTKIYNDTDPYMYDIDLGAQVHDSILIQYPVKDFKRMAQAVLKCRDYINPTIHYNGHDFQIGTDLTIGMNWGDHHEEDNPSGMIKVPIIDNLNEMSDRLEQIYGTITG